MKACYIYYTIKIVCFILVECPKLAEIFGQILELVIRNCFKLVNRELEEKWEKMNWKFRRIYATFILGTALQNFGTRADSFPHGPLDLRGKTCSSIFDDDF